MNSLESFFSGIADKLWGDWLLFVLLGLGIFYTVITGFAQIRFFPKACRSFLSGAKNRGNAEDSGKCSSYQALCTAVASCVGSGNIVGVSTAILAGGPGALFWMWAAAFFGMATKYGEIILGIQHHGQDDKGNIVGGPMYYIAHGFKMKWVGALVAGLLFIQNAGGTLIQSNTISQVSREAFKLPYPVTGLILAGLMTLVISGGFKRLVHVAEKIVPIMAGLYIISGLLVILANITQLPDVIQSILQSAFSLKAGMGAAAGLTMKEAMRFGVARGLYSNEAGEGSAAVIHSSAEVDHPVRQGMFGIVEVFIDTMIICSTTGFTILITGANEYHTNASTLAATAFGSVFPGFQNVIYISLMLFAGTSIMSQWYFGHVSLTYLKKPGWANIYRIVFPFIILLGSMSTIDLVWSIQDCALGLLIIPNILALLVLSPEVRRLTKDFLNPENGFVNK
ncbi:MAG: alanine/glycine:cation symporter family protein [Ruminococcus sp.]